MSEEMNNLDESPSIDPPDNGGSGIASLLSSEEEVIGDSGLSESIDPPDNG